MTAAPEDNPVSRRTAIIGLGLLATTGAAAAVTPRRHEFTLGSAKLADVVPVSVGEWRYRPGGSVIVPDADQAGSFYDQVLTRTFYADAAPPVMLLIAYGAAQSGLMKIHRPEVCYASAGFNITRFHASDVRLNPQQTIAGQEFIAQRDARFEQVLYWTRISNAFPRDLTGQRLVMLERGIHGVIPDGVLVRLSTVGTDFAHGAAMLDQFARDLCLSAEPQGRALLLGRLRPQAG